MVTVIWPPVGVNFSAFGQQVEGDLANGFFIGPDQRHGVFGLEGEGYTLLVLALRPTICMASSTMCEKPEPLPAVS